MHKYFKSANFRGAALCLTKILNVYMCLPTNIYSLDQQILGLNMKLLSNDNFPL